MRKQEKKENAPFFSVVLTTYNRAILLKRALQSLFDQTESDWEAIIVDDGSEDDTFVQISSYLHADRKIRYTKQMNQGPAAAKNTGMLLSTGNFLTFLDSDDEYRSDHLKLRKDLLKQHPAVGFLYGGVKIIGNKFVPDKNKPGETINLSDCVIGGTFFIKREAALSLNGFENIPLGNDAAFFEKVKKAGIMTMETTFPSYIYHREPHQSITHNFRRGGE